MRRKMSIFLACFLFIQFIITSCGVKPQERSWLNEAAIVKQAESFTQWSVTDVELAEVLYPDFTLVEVEEQGETFRLLQSSNLDILIKADDIQLFKKENGKYQEGKSVPVSIGQYLGRGEVTVQKIDVTKDLVKDVIILYKTGGTGMLETTMYIIDGKTEQLVPISYDTSEFESYIKDFSIKKVDLTGKNAELTIEVTDVNDNSFNNIASIPKGAYQTDMECRLATDLMDLKEITDTGNIKVSTAFTVVSNVVSYVGNISSILYYDDNKKEFLLDGNAIEIEFAYEANE